MQVNIATSAKTIEEAIAIMDEIIRNCKLRESRLGYFAALYRTVTVVVKERCDAGGYFEDDDRMRELDTIFANRYFDALFKQLRHTGTPTASWAVAFDASDETDLLILHHLLLGMNAHISLDLGIATAEVANGHMTDSLRRDFYRLNNLLESLIDIVQDEINRVSPMMGIVDRALWRIDERLAAFSINVAREHAMRFTESLIALPEADWPAAIAARDNDVAKLSRFISTVPWVARPAMWVLCRLEKRSPSEVTLALSNDAWQRRIRAGVDYIITEAESQGVDLSKRETQIMPVVKLAKKAARHAKEDA